jgi:ABC-2 type transport system permease protein
MSNGSAGGRPRLSMFRVAWLIVAFSLRRTANRLESFRSKPKKASSAREATARKGTTGRFLIFVLTALILFSGVIQSTRLVYNVAALAERQEPDSIALVDAPTMAWLEWAADERGAKPSARHVRKSGKLGEALERFAQRESLRDDAEVARRTDWRLQLFAERGVSGFRESKLRPSSFPSTDTWYGAADSRQMLVPLGLVALLLSLSCVLVAVAGTNQDLAKVEWVFEWWFTFPVPARGLLLARVLETAFANPLGWLLLAPFFSVTFWCAGFGWLGVPIGLLCVAYVGILAGCLRVTAETTLRRWVALRNVARLQAVLSVVAVLPMVAALASSSPDWLEKLVRFAFSLPCCALLSRLSPIAIAGGGARSWQTILSCAGVAVIATSAATTFGGWVLRDGLATSTGANQGTRGRIRERGGRRPFLLSALARKELRGLFRDRTMFSQTFVLPGVIFGMQLLMNHGFARTLTASPQHAAGMAFAVAGLVLSTGACNTLAVEVPALWIYFTIPKALDRLFVDKAIFWSCIASLIATAVYGSAAALGSWSPFGGAAMFALVLVGVTLNAFIASGIGVLGTNALESDAKRRISPSMTYLYMLLGGTFAYALYAPSAWAKFAQVVLSTLLAYALWQKVRDHAPFLLDPNDKPAPTIAVADGIIAALAFFILQGLLALYFASSGQSSGLSLLLAFSLAGLLTGSVMLLSFWRIGVPQLFSRLGMRAPRGGFARGILTGLAVGLVCGVVAQGYLFAVDHVAVLRRLRDETVSLSNADGARTSVWFAALAIVAAPVFEEFIFRGVLFGGFRRSFGALGAAASSALVFAIVHPAIACAPVFVLGFAAALVYERERSLLVPMATHMTYNAVVVGLAFRGR